jgi:CHAD domain-containing protein
MPPKHVKDKILVKDQPTLEDNDIHPSTEPAQAQAPEFCGYGVGVIASRLDKLLAHTEGAKSGQDTNAIHQMRVWSRRSRAALDVFGMCFTGKTAQAFAKMEAEVKNVTSALGAARDLDVMLETLGKLAESLPAEQRNGVESLAAHLHATRDDRQTAVRDAVEHLEGRHLKKSLQRMADRQGYRAVTLTVPPPEAPADKVPADKAPGKEAANV